MNNHFPSLFDNNVLEKVDSNTVLVEVALDAVMEDRDSTRITLQKIHISRSFRVRTLIKYLKFV